MQVSVYARLFRLADQLGTHLKSGTGMFVHQKRAPDGARFVDSVVFCWTTWRPRRPSIHPLWAWLGPPALGATPPPSAAPMRSYPPSASLLSDGHGLPAIPPRR